MIRFILVAVGLTCAALSSFAGQPQGTFPQRPITLLVPYPPGGAGDLIARLLAQKLSDGVGQQVVVENKPGASGVLASQALVRAPADGHTLLLVVNTHAINSILMRKLPYDPAKDMVPVATFAASRFLLAVSPGVAARTLQSFSALARTGDGLTYGTIGSAGIGRLAGEMFARAIGTHIRHIPYKGSGPLLTAVLSGEVNFVIDTPSVYLPHIHNGRIRPIAISGGERLASLPGVPTFKEAELDQFDLKMWFGIMAPANTPPAVVERVSNEIRAISKMADVQERLTAFAFEPYFKSPPEFAALLRAETERYSKIIQSAGIRPE
jgi:tripartite-type tricarboxylate transporter receptor subunit TctC